MRCSRQVLLSCLVLVVSGAAAQAQISSGFTVHVPAAATGEERNAQISLWVMDVEFKPMRMIAVTLTDPKTGRKSREFVWYLMYRAVNRPLEQQAGGEELVPVNTFDDPPGPPVFAPEFTLRTDDNGVQTIYHDVILPEALEEIRRREVREPRFRPFLRDSVEIVGPVPEPVAPDAENVSAIYGVAMWRGINPETDFFTVFVSGFSNGYKLVKGPVKYESLQELVAENRLQRSDAIWDTKSAWVPASTVGNLFEETKDPPLDAAERLWFYTVTSDGIDPASPPQIWRKTLVQKFWRPGDKFDQNEKEFREMDEPQWLYRPDAPSPKTNAKQAKRPGPSAGKS